MVGQGIAWLDDVSIEVIGTSHLTGPNPLTLRASDNLIAFARLYGYIRFFNPSDQAVDVDWERLAIDGIEVVEPAASPEQLALLLEGLFLPVAPSVRVFETAKMPVLPRQMPVEGIGDLQITMWRHVGVELGNAGIYSSKRLLSWAPNGRIPRDFADPREPIRIDLPGGVTCLVPIALFVDANGTLPHSMPLKRTQPLRTSGDDRSTRLADVIIAWNVLQHFYPYFDVVKTNWATVLQVALSRAATDDNGDAFLTTLEQMIAALHDGHGRVGSTRGPGEFVPPIIWTWVDGRIIALSVSGVDGIEPGDALISIDQKPATEVLAAKELLISGATPQWIRYRALFDLLARKRGDPVLLEIDPINNPGTRRSMLLRCASNPFQLQELRPDTLTEVEEGIFYLDLGRLTVQEYLSKLPILVKARGIIFDMRGYPGNITANMQNLQAFLGHLLRRSVTSPQLLIPVVTRPDRLGVSFKRSDWMLEPLSPYLTAKLAFLTDGRTISAAETVMGIVEHYGLAEIVGEPTAGTNGNINPFALPGGYSVTWTGMKVLKQDGSQHHGVGISPTIKVLPTRAGIAARRDEILERAIEAVKR